MTDSLRWIFGYGSIVWRPAFAYEERVIAEIHGFARRFWQGSPDHRGCPDAPGRVATLVAEEQARCSGVAFRVRSDAWTEVLARLDERESGGFERREVMLHFGDGRASEPGLTYIAGPENPNFLGPAAPEKIAAQVRRSRGKSGANSDYVLRLAHALRAIGDDDPHVIEIAALLRCAPCAAERSPHEEPER